MAKFTNNGMDNIYIEMFLFSQQKMKYNDEYDGDIVVMYVT